MPKNPSAQALGSLGGRKTASLMTKEQLIARATKASLAAVEARKKKALSTGPEQKDTTPEV